MFLKNTVEDILKNKSDDTEIIIGLDGQWAAPQITDHPDVTIIHSGIPIGQRAMTNQCVRLSQAKFVAKCDAHCSFDKDFDKKLLADMHDDWTMVPIMRNLHAFDWKCRKCGHRTYQGPTPTSCAKCDNKTDFKRSMVWVGKENPQSTSYCFDSEPHFQYFKEYTTRPEYKKMLQETGLTETMSLQGSFFLCTREKYWELNLCDEGFGSWGNQGIEIATKTVLSGGRLVVSQKTWYAHMFRTQGGDFSFPYPQSGRQVQECKKKVRDMLWNNSWDKQVYPLSKLIDKFVPVPGWTDEDYKNLKMNELKVKRSGIYSIKNTVSGKVYIGSSINLASRLGEHLRKLKGNCHSNKYLQSAWNKYGESSFTFNIEYFCVETELLKYEKRIVDSYKEKLGWRQMYNLRPEPTSNLGFKHSPESLVKMSTQQCGEGNGFYGKKHSEETREKIRNAHIGKESWNKGIPCSEKTKEKIRISQMGKEAWNKGLTKKTDERIRIYGEKLLGRKRTWQTTGMLGKHHTNITKRLIGSSQRGIPKSEEHNRKNSEAHKGKIFTKEHRINLSLAQKNVNRSRNNYGQFV